MTKLFKSLKPYTLALIGLFILVFIQVMTDLQLPDYMAKIVNHGIADQNNALIINTGIRMLLVSLLGAVCAIGVGFLAARIATGFSMNLREKVFTKVESFSMREFDKFSTASLITRSTNDIQQIQMVFIIILRMVLSAPIMGVGAVIKAYNMAPSMSWIIALAVTVLFGIIIVLFSIALPKYKMLQKLVDKLNLVTRENLTGLRVIRAFNTEKHEEAKFDEANVDLTELNLFVNRLMVVMQPLMMLIFNVTSIAIVWIGAHLIGTGNLMVGDMIAFMQYAMQVIMSFLMISIIFIMVPRAAVSAQRVVEVTETDPVIKNPKKPKKFTAGQKGIVEFKNVTFSYSGADVPVLKSITFTANPGETTAFIGSTGSGKSTLINLITRFYDVTEGQVLVDGLDVRDVNQEDLFDKIGYIPQKGVLFSGSVTSNIKYGAQEASDKEMRKAVEIAQAYDFVMELEDNFKAPIAQGGTNVSGGQKQRLSIARAIIKKPEIYIFDDSFSALDFKTDAALRNALNAETKSATVLIVAQRISTIMNAEKIIVLNEGEIVGMGKHAELLDSCPVYKEIASSQLSEEELARNNKNETNISNNLLSTEELV
jgi:ATP-binding cassette subfamily B multidrug efflux pump